jgi:ankyrin repeat protein
MPFSTQDLFQAAQKGDVDTFSRALAEGVSIQVVDSARNTVLHEAAKKGHTALVQLLLKHIPVDTEGQGKFTALHSAVLNGHTNIVKILLEAGASPNAKTLLGDTVLYLALHSYHLNEAHMLIHAGANVNAVAHADSTILHFVSKEGNTDAVNLLIQAGAAVDRRNQNQETPLQCYLDTIRRTKASGDRIIAPKEYAAMQQAVRSFLEKGANLEFALQKLGLTSLREGIMAGHLFENTQADVVVNFAKNPQNTHNHYVERTAYISTDVLRERYKAVLSPQEIALIQDEIVLKAAEWGTLWGNEAAFIEKTKDFLYRKMTASDDKDVHYWSANLTMPQVVACVWKAIHDSTIRYQTTASLEQEILDAEEAFFKAVSNSANCIQGGYFHILLEACAVSRIPGIYLIRLDLEQVHVTDYLKKLLDPIELFELFPETLSEGAIGLSRDQILTDRVAYAAFMEKIVHNQAIYARYGKNSQHIHAIKDSAFISNTPEMNDWVWFTAEELHTLQDRLTLSHEAFQTAIGEKKALKALIPITPISTPEDDEKSRYRTWAAQLTSDNLQTNGQGWEALREYYSKDRFKGDLTAFQQSLNAGRTGLLSLIDFNTDTAEYVDVFFDTKQKEICNLNGLQPTMLFTPVKKSSFRTESPDKTPPKKRKMSRI